MFAFLYYLCYNGYYADLPQTDRKVALMSIMNSAEILPSHGSLSRELSALRTMGDIYYQLNRRDLTVTLDFRPMSAAKFTAVALVENTGSTETVTDLNRAIELFESALYTNYSRGILYVQRFDTFFVEVQLNSCIWSSVVTFLQALRAWLTLAEINLAPSHL